MNTLNGFHVKGEDKRTFSVADLLQDEDKTITLIDRRVGYHIFPHFHPYVGVLAQKLLTTGLTGLQASDTEYTKDRAAFPGSIMVSLAQGANLTIPQGANLALLAPTPATAGGAAVQLPAQSRVQALGAVGAALPDGLLATLMNGMKGAPKEGESFPLPAANRSAVVSAPARVTLAADTPVLRAGNAEATLPAGTTLLLAAGTQLTFPNGAQVTLVRMKRVPVLYAPIFSENRYNPSALVSAPFPVKELDFTTGGAYAVYNWELYFHIPMAVAVHLSKNQRYAEAQQWFHYLFDPTDDSDGPTPERFWKVRPFQTTDVKKIEEILINLATGAEDSLRKETVRSIEAWMDAPFRPHVIARYRQQAYMLKTVMAYLDNLIAWGDSLFRQDTGESIDEAMMLYVLAANILGPRPQPVPVKGTLRPQTYDNLRKDLRQFGAVVRDVEADLPFDLMPFPADGAIDADRLATVRSLGKSLYFGVPVNDKLLSYWDTVADRLFKIRNSLNFQGVFRRLAMFEPPIDPALLARATAAGLDMAAIVNGVNQPLPLVRFSLLVQKAAEIAQEVKSLGSNLLSAMEKEDGEAMAILRARHERTILEMAEQVKYSQLQDAIKSKEGLLLSLAVTVQRYTFYERQLGKKLEEIQKAIPALSELDKDSLEKMKFSMQEPAVAPRAIDVDIASDIIGQAAQIQNGGKLISSYEAMETVFLDAAQIAADVSNMLNIMSSFANLVPSASISLEPWGIGGSVSYGGSNIGSSYQAGATAVRMLADELNFAARQASRIDGFARREREWAFQSNLAAGEIAQIFKQLRAAQIREAIATMELKNHRKQIQQAQEVERFLNEEGTEKTGKRTNKSLYTWMKREVKGIYGQSFQLAFDIAKKAERALQHELGNTNLTYVDYGYLAGKEGLLAGEKLFLDIKRMELAFHDLNAREYELTKHISLLQINPLALLQLRATGRCVVRVPEELFDWDGPGQYFRRIKSAALSIPCVTGPYASVNCKLTLLKSSIRKKQTLIDGSYVRVDAEDERFDDYFGSLQSIVTSSAQNDSGLFETNLRDERYLPFENSGAISEWLLELPANPAKGDPHSFDYDTISDVILHLRYTAREGGGLLRSAALDNLKTGLKAAQVAGSVRLFSMRHEFPTEWAKFQNNNPGAGKRNELTITLLEEHYPFWTRNKLDKVKRVDLIAKPTGDPAPTSLDVFDKVDDQGGAAQKDTLTKGTSLGSLLSGQMGNIALPGAPTGVIKLFFTNKALSDIWITVTWSIK